MTEEEARAWIDRHVPRETAAALERLVAMVLNEMPNQNLIAASTADHIWTRHIVDSAQLLPLAPDGARRWIDLGSGAGFPGLVVSLMRPELEMILVESRRKRIDFLRFMAESLGLADRVAVAGQRLELLEASPQDVISARAFAPLDRLLPLAHRFSHPGTVWLLPKGRSAVSELEAVTGSWQGDFRVVPSMTDSEAAIIVASQVRPNATRQKAKRQKEHR
ncbi:MULTISPECIES: 16S rRNA (guanine(527)-N(7))-methyltransferase RsmG [unclassified Sphingomonas]|uniref:16S rRNA (guanine(527)-N(7))-methyltransferase RsmG n=1 Tax=unclassified Sphingomonas TaxID=196159 RepID=UPI000700189E|nr:MULTISPECIES: 16S rRNA (guanine(527)-N(7))-methyltransferase RsmG [unclassified Sphingomonas]KQX21520.1 16S rRNA (guanine(527)-N(7))-methyltransferase RsmG [Sphingomonas sp. Root1294]KQY72837.1 16S rRNA (guanine(527)-N(7))-methyltransferase RsmG [Sphingomonas sp. Root50]KRB88370.1 16S rRNA (guanine(527)-N(7))-methyltransferase RsmG [Sphingomonas sp. Root720]